MFPLKYRKIPVISPGLTFVQKVVSLGLFWGYFRRGLLLEGILRFKVGWACQYEQPKIVRKHSSTNSPWAYIREGLLSEGFLLLRFGGLIFGRD